MLSLSVLSFRRDGKRSRIFNEGVSENASNVQKGKKSWNEGEREGKKFFLTVHSLKMSPNVLIRLRVSLKVVKLIMSFPSPGVCLSRVPVLKTPLSEPAWQDPEFLRKFRGLESTMLAKMITKIILETI